MKTEKIKKVIWLCWLASIISWSSYSSSEIIVNDSYLSILKRGKLENKYTLLISGSYASSNYKENDPYSSDISSSFYSEHFIVAKYSTDNEVHRELKAVLGVGTYPALYFFNPYGKLIYMEIGAMNPEMLLKLGEKVILIDSEKRNDDLNVEAPYKKLQRKWYTSKALGLYASRKMKIEKEDNLILVKYEEGDNSLVVSYLKKGFKYSSQNDYLYYLRALVLYGDGYYTEAKKSASIYKNLSNEEDLSPEIIMNFNILLN
jgi:thioredoxin-related protein